MAKAKAKTAKQPRDVPRANEVLLWRSSISRGLRPIRNGLTAYMSNRTSHARRSSALDSSYGPNKTAILVRRLKCEDLHHEARDNLDFEPTRHGLSHRVVRASRGPRIAWDESRR